MSSTKESNPKDAVGVRKWRHFCTVPMTVMAELGVAMLEGGRKYGRHNYRVAGVRASVYTDAAMGHIMQWWEGEDIDADSDLSHITKAIASLVVLRDAMIQEMLTDDRPPKANLDTVRDNLGQIVESLFDRIPAPLPPHTEADPQIERADTGRAQAEQALAPDPARLALLARRTGQAKAAVVELINEAVAEEPVNEAVAEEPVNEAVAEEPLPVPMMPTRTKVKGVTLSGMPVPAPYDPKLYSRFIQQVSTGRPGKANTVGLHEPDRRDLKTAITIGSGTHGKPSGITTEAGREMHWRLTCSSLACMPGWNPTRADAIGDLWGPWLKEELCCARLKEELAGTDL